MINVKRHFVPLPSKQNKTKTVAKNMFLFKIPCIVNFDLYLIIKIIAVGNYNSRVSLHEICYIGKQ